MKFGGLWFWLMAIAVLALMFIRSPAPTKELSVNQLYDAMDAGLIEKLEVSITNGEVKGVLKDPKTNQKLSFISRVADVKELEVVAKEKDIELKVVETKQSSWGVVLYWFFFVGVFLLLFWWLGRGIFGGSRNMKIFPKAHTFNVENNITTRFSDVAGCDEVIEEAGEVIKFLDHPKAFQQLGIQIPKGILLIGPPGTGKTLLARAMAGEAGVAFVAINGSDFVQMFVGVGAARVRELFDEAKKHAPSIVFIDELDAVGKSRVNAFWGGGGGDEREQTLNAILAEMDGFAENTGVTVLAATNRPEMLDPALRRAGRFDRTLTMPLPDVAGREAILKVHSKNRKLASDVNLGTIARMTIGFSGADLQNLMNEAAILIYRRTAKNEIQDDLAITQIDLEAAFDKITLGPEKKSRVISQKDKELTAYHEAGHVLSSRYCQNADPLRRVTIIPRGLSGGAAHYLPVEDRQYYRKNYLLDQLVVLMGGRAAEILEFGEETSGASHDFAQATRIAKSMVCEFGMSEKIGAVIYGRHDAFLGQTEALDCSPDTKLLIEQAVRQFLDEAYEKTGRILKEHKDQLDKIAQALLEKETLDAAEIDLLLSGYTN